MGEHRDYIPSNDAEFDNWFKNLRFGHGAPALRGTRNGLWARGSKSRETPPPMRGGGRQGGHLPVRGHSAPFQGNSSMPNCPGGKSHFIRHYLIAVFLTRLYFIALFLLMTNTCGFHIF
jgi:hypothetical protein